MNLPGPKSEKILNKLSRLNIGYSHPYPFVYSNKGKGCYFYDIDGNKFLDFASLIAANPLGYNNPELVNVVKRYSKQFPIKYAGQDFTIKEHADLLEELTSITPKGLNEAMLINSGAEAVENCIKLALRKRKNAKFGVAFLGAFHGRTLGALSATSSNPIYKKDFLFIPMKHLPFHVNAIEHFENLISEYSPEDIGFVIIEPIQGEGGYNIAPQVLIRGLRKLTKEYGIPLILDEVQTGMGRTGKWWCSENYDITPDIMSASKALQVGAAISNEKYRPEPGTISSTWGGGHVIDMALGVKTIEIIKKRKLLNNVNKMGNYLLKNLQELDNIQYQRGMGLMCAFDLPSREVRNNFIIECLKNGLVLLGCGDKSVRVIPPYIVSEDEIDRAIQVIKQSALKTLSPKFKHTGKVCDYLTCGEVHT